jgi:hypothetical protein
MYKYVYTIWIPEAQKKATAISAFSPSSPETLTLGQFPKAPRAAQWQRRVQRPQRWTTVLMQSKCIIMSTWPEASSRFNQMQLDLVLGSCGSKTNLCWLSFVVHYDRFTKLFFSFVSVDRGLLSRRRLQLNAQGSDSTSRCYRPWEKQQLWLAGEAVWTPGQMEAKT